MGGGETQEREKRGKEVRVQTFIPVTFNEIRILKTHKWTDVHRPEDRNRERK